jgi:prophage regulatory protein
LSRSTIYRRIGEASFPRPISLGARSIGWPEEEIEAFNRGVIRGASEDDLRRLVGKLEASRKSA